MVYVDTSVLAAYYCPETLSAKAEQAILRAGRTAISLLVDVELASAVARKRREGVLDKTDVARIVGQFNLHVADGCYVRFPVEVSHFDLAKRWIEQGVVPLRTLDALHLAVCFGNSAVLLTADAALAKAARHFRVRVELLTA